MNRKIFYLLGLIIGLLVNLNIAVSAEYKLGAGDIISLTVFDEPDMSLNEVRVTKVGKVTFPYIGDVKVIGLTVRKLKKIISKKLKNGYLKNPQIVVSIVGYRPFFVNGEVKAPGGYPYVEGLTIRKAIAIAGGLTDRASLKKISVISEKTKKKKKYAGSLEVSMNPGDILTIGEALF